MNEERRWVVALKEDVDAGLVVVESNGTATAPETNKRPHLALASRNPGRRVMKRCLSLRDINVRNSLPNTNVILAH